MLHWVVWMPSRATFEPLAVLNTIPRQLSTHCLVGTSLHEYLWNTQHAAPSISSKLSIVLKCRRCFSIPLMFCTHPFLALGNLPRCLVPVNFSRYVHDFPNGADFDPTRHDLRHESDNVHSTCHAEVMILHCKVDSSRTPGSLSRRQHQRDFLLFDSSPICGLS